MSAQPAAAIVLHRQGRHDSLAGAADAARQVLALGEVLGKIQGGCLNGKGHRDYSTC